MGGAREGGGGGRETEKEREVGVGAVREYETRCVSQERGGGV